MAISYLTILSNQKLIPKLFTDERWQNISLEEKKEIVYSLFHINNWNQLEPQYRIYFLQELENINANIQKRIPYKIVMLDELTDCSEKKLSSVCTGPEGSNEIHITSEYLLNGRRNRVMLNQDGSETVEKQQLDNLNVEVFCSICHEGEHVKQEVGSKGNVNTKEINECRLNFLGNLEDNTKSNRIEPSQSMILYKLQPAEYYAFKNSEEMTRKVFLMLQAKFGIDYGYVKWDKQTRSNDFEVLAKKWNEDNDMEELLGVGYGYTVEGIRKMIIRAMLYNVLEWYGVKDSEEACKKLNLDYNDYIPKMKEDIGKNSGNGRE